jgi:hypothetical protein
MGCSDNQAVARGSSLPIHSFLLPLTLKLITQAELRMHLTPNAQKCSQDAGGLYCHPKQYPTHRLASLHMSPGDPRHLHSTGSPKQHGKGSWSLVELQKAKPETAAAECCILLSPFHVGVNGNSQLTSLA